MLSDIVREHHARLYVIASMNKVFANAITYLKFYLVVKKPSYCARPWIYRPTLSPRHKYTFTRHSGDMMFISLFCVFSRNIVSLTQLGEQYSGLGFCCTCWCNCGKVAGFTSCELPLRVASCSLSPSPARWHRPTLLPVSHLLHTAPPVLQLFDAA